MFWVTYIIFTAVCLHTISASTMEDVKTLITDLMVNYSREVRPVKDQTRAVSVDAGMALVSINDFNEVTGIISVVAVLFLSWTDESLEWDSSSYNNTTFLTFSQENIWVPKMYLLNPANDFNPISNKHFQITVQANGFVTWSPGGILQATCTPDVSNFPFDQQTCTIAINTYGYATTQVSLTTQQPTITTTYFSPNSAWDVTSTTTSVTSVNTDIAAFSITMSRRSLNFMVSVVIPIIMLALVNPFVFILPFTSGERTSYSITVLLAFTVYMTVVSERMPASSDPISQLSYYLLVMLGLSVLIVTMNIFQIRTYSKHDGDEPVPPWMSNLVMYLQKVCQRGRVETELKEQHDNDRNEPMKTLHIIRLDSIDETDIASIQSPPKEKDRIQTASSQQEKITWYTVARYTDKLYFTAFLVFTVFATLGYFLVVTT